MSKEAEDRFEKILDQTFEEYYVDPEYLRIIELHLEKGKDADYIKAALVLTDKEYERLLKKL